jgi:hypothetical protein
MRKEKGERNRFVKIRPKQFVGAARNIVDSRLATDDMHREVDSCLSASANVTLVFQPREG